MKSAQWTTGVTCSSGLPSFPKKYTTHFNIAISCDLYSPSISFMVVVKKSYISPLIGSFLPHNASQFKTYSNIHIGTDWSSSNICAGNFLGSDYIISKAQWCVRRNIGYLFSNICTTTIYFIQSLWKERNENWNVFICSSKIYLVLFAFGKPLEKYCKAGS